MAFHSFQKKLSINLNTTKVLFFSLSLVALLIAVIALGSINNKAGATSASGFNAGHIIDDSVFTNTTTMDVASIQNFLSSKVSSCDTNGSQSASDFGYPNLTHAQYAANQGWPAPPYTCLKDYSVNGLSSAQMIYNISQQFRINPQVLIVLLQKEQGLVTDTWPLPGQYKTATGYGCPDTAPCDSEYFGLGNQLTWSGKMFRSIMDNNPNWYTPYILGQNNIQYNPNASCGSSTVNIENRATQALYNYTPYQPNQAALNAGYANAPPCGAYGNRNFYLYFTDWFGPTTGPAYSWSLNSYNVYSDTAMTQKINDKNIINLSTNQSAYVSISAQNIGINTWQQADLLMGTPNISTPFHDTTWISRDRASRMVESSVPYGSAGTFNFKITAPSQPNVYYQNFNIVIDGLQWFNNVGPSFQLNVSNSITPPVVGSANTIASGKQMNPGDFISSPDNNSVLRFENGQLSLYSNFSCVWRSPTTTATSVVNQPDGNLVMHNTDGSIAWSSNTSGNGVSSLQLQLDGNLVLYSPSGTTWSSNTPINNQANRINNILKNDQALFTNQKLITPDRGRILLLQGDGNLVLYTPYRVAWASNTAGSGATRLVMQPDGNLVLYTNTGRPVWASNTAGRGASDVLLQMDSNLVIYGKSSTWSTNTSGM
jgi:hypothetical protein